MFGLITFSNLENCHPFQPWDLFCSETADDTLELSRLPHHDDVHKQGVCNAINIIDNGLAKETNGNVFKTCWKLIAVTMCTSLVLDVAQPCLASVFLFLPMEDAAKRSLCSVLLFTTGLTIKLFGQIFHPLSRS